MKVPFQKQLRLLWTYILPYKRRVALISFLILINVAVKIINPLIIRFYLDSVTSVSDVDVLSTAALLFIAVAIIGEGVYVINVYLSADLAWKSTNNLRFDLFKHVANLDMTYHNQHKPGEMIERVDGDVNALSNFFSIFSLMIISNVLLIVGILITMLRENVSIGTTIGILVVVSIYLMAKTRLIAIEDWKKSRETSTELMGFIEERLGGTEEIKANAGEERVYEKFHILSKNEYQVTNRAVWRSNLTTVTTFFTIGIGTTLIYTIGIPQVQNNSITVGTLYLYTYLFQLLLDPIFQILRQMWDLQRADASIDRVNELFALTSSLPNDGTDIPSSGPAEIEFKDLSFAYHKEEFVLNNISFKIPAKKSLGLIGKTGSGKSTISRLLFRLYDYEHGEMLFNGNSTKNYEIKELRKAIEIVTQEVELFNATIRDNITFFNPQISDDRILEVLELIDMMDWLNKQPKKLDTIITKSGLSAGEAQLLAFARAFISDPSLVILDEASSRLDPATEHLIEKAMEKLLEGRTSIIIAHRLETLNRVDDILLLEDGKVAEYGKRKDLISDPNSKYSQLLELGLEEVLS